MSEPYSGYRWLGILERESFGSRPAQRFESEQNQDHEALAPTTMTSLITFQDPHQCYQFATADGYTPSARRYDARAKIEQERLIRQENSGEDATTCYLSVLAPIPDQGAFVKLQLKVNLVIGSVAAFFLTAPSISHAQLSDLPVRPGLWEAQVSMNASEPVPGQYCFSAGTTLGDYLTASNKGTPGAHCSVSNKVKTAGGVSYDTACTSQAMNSKGHIDVQLPDSEHFGGTSHTTVTRTGGGKSMNIDKTFKATFAKSDCGSIKPLVIPSSSPK